MITITVHYHLPPLHLERGTEGVRQIPKEINSEGQIPECTGGRGRFTGRLTAKDKPGRS